MSDQGIKSRPGYRPLALDPRGARHLLLVDKPTLAPTALAPGLSVTDFDERWLIAGNSRAIPVPGPSPEHFFRSAEHMLLILRRRLETEGMGLRLYAVGTEHFAWDVAGIGERAGLSRAEIRLFAVGSQARRVYCNHCRTITADVTTNILACPGCGAHLFVRDHFSRRMNAFAGVQVDAEVPGEIPQIEELYP